MHRSCPSFSAPLLCTSARSPSLSFTFSEGAALARKPTVTFLSRPLSCARESQDSGAARDRERELLPDRDRHRYVCVSRLQLSTNTACACSFTTLASLECAPVVGLGARLAAPCGPSGSLLLCHRCASRVLCPRPEPRATHRAKQEALPLHASLPHLYAGIRHTYVYAYAYIISNA